jgi:hypothetical protein
MDSGVAVTLQLEGAKLWKYAQEPALRWSTRVGGYRENERLEWFGESDWQPHDGTVPTPRDQDIAQRTLKPGDLLVMPPGVWHSVAASESTSISLNLKLTAAPAIDGILQVVRQACLHETRWRQPFPFASSDELDSGVASESAKCYVAEMVRDLGRTIAALADDEAALARLWFRNFLGSQDSIRAIASRAIQLSDVLAVPHGIHPRLSVASDGSAALLAQGKILHMRGTGVAEVVAAILRTRRFRASDVSTWPSARELASADVTRILQKLADAGFIALEMFEQS